MGNRKAPVFVVGCPRSGTTLLYHMLLSSGNFAVYLTETNVFNQLSPRFGDLGVLKNRQKLMNEWLQSKQCRRSGLDPQYIESKILAECRSAGDFIRIIMGEIARNQSVDRWADTTAEHLIHLPEIKKSLPDALMVHVIRDGRDVALSLKKIGWLRPFRWNRNQSLMVAGLFWQWMVRKGRKYGRMIAPNYMEMRFEDLVDRPRETLARVGAFIQHDLDYDRIREVAIGTLTDPNSSFKDESNRDGFNPIGRWKERLGPEEVVALETLIGQTLEELGYSLARVDGQSRSALDLKMMRSIYPLYLDFKLWLKSNTPLGKFADMRPLELAKDRINNPGPEGK